MPKMTKVAAEVETQVEGTEVDTPKESGQATLQESESKGKGGKEKKVKYQDVRAKICKGEDALTSDDAKKMLGWMEDSKPSTFGQDYLLKDTTGRKIRCSRNAKNRPFYQDNCDSLVQELLNNRWKLNGETAIIGQYGTLQNGQHSLVALILANQIRFSDKWKSHYDSIFGEDEPITMEKVIVFGIPETDDVINTMDTCRPRSYADVLYRSDVYSSAKASERKTLCKMSEWAVKMVWHRSGAVDNPFAPRRTHSEAVDFLHNHPHLSEAVMHVFQENQAPKAEEGQPAGKPPISKFISPGYASGLLYLMAASGTTEEQATEYRANPVFKEKNIDMERYEKACEFWVCLAQSPSFDAVREALGRLADPSTGASGRREEKEAVIAKAWNVFVTGRDPKLSDLKLKFLTNKDGVQELKDDPTQHFGGIDLGPGKHEVANDEDSPEKELTEEEIEARKAKVKEDSLNGTLDNPEGEGEEVVTEQESSEGEETQTVDEESVFDQFDSSEQTEEEVIAEEEPVEEVPSPKKKSSKKPLLLDVDVPPPGSGPKKNGKKKQPASA